MVVVSDASVLVALNYLNLLRVLNQYCININIFSKIFPLILSSFPNQFFAAIPKINLLFHYKVIVIVIGTAGVKACSTNRALVVTVKVLINAEFSMAGSTKYCFGIKFSLLPQFRCMTCSFRMAVNTRIIFITAFHTDGYDIPFRMIVHTSCVIVYGLSFYINVRWIVQIIQRKFSALKNQFYHLPKYLFCKYVAVKPALQFHLLHTFFCKAKAQRHTCTANTVENIHPFIRF